MADTLAALVPAPLVKVLELPGLPEKGDIADWIDAHGDAAEPDDMRAENNVLAAGTERWRSEPPVRSDDLRFRPSPVNALPEPVRGFAAGSATAIGCDPSYISLPLLVALAAAVGNARRLQLKRGWATPAILWGAVVGESGTMKTPAFKLVTRPARLRQGAALKQHTEAMKGYEAELARWEKDMAAWKRDKKATGDPPAKPDPPRASGSSCRTRPSKPWPRS